MTKEVGAGSTSKQFLTDTVNAANDAYKQLGIDSSAKITAPGGLKILQHKNSQQDVTMYSKATGFYGAAFETSNKKDVLITFEGTNFFTHNAEFTAGQVVDDADITAGRFAPSFETAMTFTASAVAAAEKQGYSASSIYLDGHSLGAADAEYVAAQTGMKGVTFGTPGIATRFFTKPTAKLTNYVEAGDPVGNYDASSKSPIQNIVQSISPTSMHYGKTNYIGHSAPDDGLYTYYQRLHFASVDYAKGTEDKVLKAAGWLASAVPAHFLSQYAKSLKVKLADKDHTYGSGLDILCVAQGTRIRTTRGDVAIEALEVGDLVVTAAGVERPVRWLGHRRLDRRQLLRQPSARPVRISKDAFGTDMPIRDLLVSPGHAICVAVGGDVLVPAGALVDGAAVAQVEVEEITYWHVELESHDVILAENLAVESYLDMGGRAFFAEAAIVELDAAPDPATRSHADFCRPYADRGPLVEAIRRRLGVRAVASPRRELSRIA